jgi:D-arginine dehydrogenase
MQSCDIIVIGAGIAGASAAAELAADARVVLLEMESQPGYHASGRSAAYFATSYGHPIVQEITASCEHFLRTPPEGFADVDLLIPRDNMWFAREDQADSLAAMQAGNPRLQFVDEKAIRERVPVFKPGYLHGGLWDRRGGDLDVDALLQGYIRLFRRRGGRLHNSHEVKHIEHQGGRWLVTAGGQRFAAPIVVNAAGGWVEHIALLAGLEPLGIQAMRRTALTVGPPPGVEIGDWPEMVDIDEEFYFKPDAGLIMISPADETPTRPVDAQPEDIDVEVRASWAGLRTFAPDRLFVTGFDPRADGFFWLAGQGGYGVQSAPAMAMLTRYLVSGAEPEGDFSVVLKHVDAVAPGRLL